MFLGCLRVVRLVRGRLRVEGRRVLLLVLRLLVVERGEEGSGSRGKWRDGRRRGDEVTIGGNGWL